MDHIAILLYCFYACLQMYFLMVIEKLNLIIMKHYNKALDICEDTFDMNDKNKKMN